MRGPLGNEGCSGVGFVLKAPGFVLALRLSCKPDLKQLLGHRSQTAAPRGAVDGVAQGCPCTHCVPPAAGGQPGHRHPRSCSPLPVQPCVCALSECSLFPMAGVRGRAPSAVSL